jgi:hypothetical protein
MAGAFGFDSPAAPDVAFSAAMPVEFAFTGAAARTTLPEAAPAPAAPATTGIAAGRAAAELVSQYHAQLMGDSNVRFLMGSLGQNARDETLDSAAAVRALHKAVQTVGVSLGEARLAVTAYFNALWFAGPERLPREFWWEMRYRLLKLLHVALVLEARMLRSFGVTSPTHRNIPQALVFVYDYIVRECTDAKLADVAQRFDAACARNPAWCQFYLGSF